MINLRRKICPICKKHIIERMAHNFSCIKYCYELSLGNYYQWEKFLLDKKNIKVVNNFYKKSFNCAINKNGIYIFDDLNFPFGLSSNLLEELDMFLSLS